MSKKIDDFLREIVRVKILLLMVQCQSILLSYIGGMVARCINRFSLVVVFLLPFDLAATTLDACVVHLDLLLDLQEFSVLCLI